MGFLYDGIMFETCGSGQRIIGAVIREIIVTLVIRCHFLILKV